MHKAPMPYPHLGPCTSRGMSKTIAPPRGPTWKHCLGPQVSPQPCYHNRSTPESGSCVGGRWEVDIGWYWNREPLEMCRLTETSREPKREALKHGQTTL